MSVDAVSSLRSDARVIGLVGVAHGVSHFFHLILASLFPWLKDAFGLSYAELGLVMTAFFIISGIGQTVAGIVVDRVGARSVLFAGLACLGLAAVLLSQAQNYAVLVAGAMLAGAGNSVFHPADFTLLNKKVSTARLGHAFSVHGIAGNIGWALAPVFMTSIAGVFGWRIALVAAGCVPMAVLALLIVYRDLLRTDEPRIAATTSKNAHGSQYGLFYFLRLPAVWMCFAFFLITSLALGGIQSFSSPSLRELYGVSLAAATAAYAAYMLASAAGMIWGGFLAAKTARHERIIACAFTGAGLLALVIATGVLPPSAALVLMGAVGFGAGIAGPSRDLLIRAATPKNATGRVYGMVYSGLDVGSSLAPPLFGVLLDAGYPAGVFVGVGLLQCMAILTALGVGNGTARRQKSGAIA